MLPPSTATTASGTSKPRDKHSRCSTIIQCDELRLALCLKIMHNIYIKEFFCVNQNLLATEALHVDFSEVDNDMLPPDLVSVMATNVVRTLVRAGIDPNAVYFRGRQGRTAEDLTTAHEAMLDAEEWGSADEFGTSHDDLLRSNKPTMTHMVIYFPKEEGVKTPSRRRLDVS